MQEERLTEKKLVGEKAAELVEDDMVVGLGTGSTVYYMIKKLAERVNRGLNITCVSTSSDTSKLATSLGIKVLDVNQVESVDITIDGADEIDDNLNAIKGGGGALLREKIVASISKKVVIIVDSTKRVEYLGRFPLPVEIVSFAHKHTLRRFKQYGYISKLREKNGSIFVTDGGNYILDVYLNKIEDPKGLSMVINDLPGVVENGLFIDLVSEVLIAEDGKLRVIKRGVK